MPVPDPQDLPEYDGESIELLGSSTVSADESSLKVIEHPYFLIIDNGDSPLGGPDISVESFGFNTNERLDRLKGILFGLGYGL